MKKVFIVLLLAGCIVGLAAAAIYAQRAADAERQVEIAEANLAALRDTVTLYEDSVTATTSLMQMQGEVAEDSILGLLGSLQVAVNERGQALRSLQTMRVQFDILRNEFESTTVEPVEDEPEAAEAQFAVEGPPVEGNLWVTYRPNAPWGLRTELGVTPFSMTYSVGCQEMSAVVNITTPPWVQTTPERGVIAPDVCNPVKPRPIFSFSWDRAVWMGVGGILGAVIANLLDDGFRSAVYDY